MRKFLIVALGTAGLAAAMPAAAQTATYNVGTSLNNPNFSYGYGVAGSSFTAFTNSYSSGCLGAATLACETSGTSGDLPAVGINTGTAPVTFYTNTVAPGTLFIQPGFASSGEDAIVNFTAHANGQFVFDLDFARIDTTSNGNGVNLLAFVNGANVFGEGGSYYLAPVAGNSAAFDATLNLKYGDIVTFGVNNNGDTSYDGTGISGTITGAVPEPATWAMLLLGFGMVGAGLRYRSKSTKARFA